jgi:metabolite-proton symporter
MSHTQNPGWIAPPPSPNAALRVAGIAGFAASIEYFDFFIYGLASALIFPKLFFPNSDPMVGLLLSFAAFGVGFLARPLGGVIFGHFGDRNGRKKALVIALLMMGVATVAVGFLPSYALAGAAAPIALVVLRLLQGIAIGGQQGGVVLMAVESAPEDKKGLYGSISSMGAPGGMLLANIAFLILSAVLSEEALFSWGWRVPFWFSIVLVVIALYIHFKLEETPAFKELQASKAAASGTVDAAQAKPARAPVWQVITKYPKQLLLCIGVYMGLNICFWLFATFVLTYGTSQQFLGLARQEILTAVLIGSTVQMFGLGFAGWLSDRIGRARTLVLGSVLLAAFSFAFWPMLNTGNLVVISIAMALGLGIFHSMLYGVQPTYFAEAFEPEVRYSGISMGIQFATVIGGAFAPLIATWLTSNFGWISLAIYMAAAALITGVSALILGEPKKRQAASQPSPHSPKIGTRHGTPLR